MSRGNKMNEARTMTTMTTGTLMRQERVVVRSSHGEIWVNGLGRILKVLHLCGKGDKCEFGDKWALDYLALNLGPAGRRGLVVGLEEVEGGASETGPPEVDILHVGVWYRGLNGSVKYDPPEIEGLAVGMEGAG